MTLCVHRRTMDAFTRKEDLIFWKMIYEDGVEWNIEGTLISVQRFDVVINGRCSFSLHRRLNLLVFFLLYSYACFF